MTSSLSRKSPLSTRPEHPNRVQVDDPVRRRHSCPVEEQETGGETRSIYAAERYSWCKPFKIGIATSFPSRGDALSYSGPGSGIPRIPWWTRTRLYNAATH